MHFFIRKYFKWLLICWFSNLAAQPSSQYLLDNIQFIGVDDGLSHRHVETILQDSKGIIWIGTEFGLDRYDGYQFLSYNISKSSPIELSSNKIISLEETKSGLMLVGTSNGLNILDLKNGTNRVILHAKDQKFKSRGFVASAIKAIKEVTDGTIWLSDGGRLCKIENIENPTLEYVSQGIDTTDTQIRDIEEDMDGNIWLTTGKNFVYQIHYSGIKTHKISEQLEVNNAYESVHAPSKFIKDLGGKIFTLSWANQDIIYQLDNSTKQFHRVEKEEHWVLPNLSSTIRTFLMKNSRISKNFHLSDKIEDIKCIEFSKDGLLWVGTTFGIFKLKPTSNFFSTHPDLHKVSLRGMHETEDGIIYMSSYSGLIKYHPELNELKIIQQKDQPYCSPIMGFKEHILLFGTEGKGLYFFNTETEEFSAVDKTVKHFEYTQKFFFSLHKDQRNENLIWLGSANSVFQLKLDQNNLIEEFKDNQGSFYFQGKKAYQFYQDIDHTIWVASRVGLFKINPDNSVEEIPVVGEKSISPSLCVYHIHPDNAGNLWLATRSRGLTRLNKESGDIRSYITNDGLSSNRVYCVLNSDQNTLWLQTEYGLSKFEIDKEQFTNFYEKDGLSNNEFNALSFLKTRSGKIYYGTIDGFTAFSPNSIEKKYNDSHLIPTKLTKYDSKFNSVKDHFFDLNTAPSIYLRGNEKFFEFSCTLTDFYRPENNHFAFLLEGYDDDWNYQGNYNTIRYTNLPAGEYTLKVKASAADGIWKKEELSIPVFVDQPFYKSAWFIFGLVLSSLLIFYLFFQYRIAQIKKIERIKTKLANDLHDDVGSLLTSIKLIAKMVHHRKMTEHEIEKELSRIIEMSNDAIATMSDVIWSLDTKKERLKDLIHRMQGHVDNTLAPLKIKKHFEVKDMDLTQKLPIDVRQNVLLIFKESIHNIIKHTKSDEVRMKFTSQNGIFKMEIVNQYESFNEGQIGNGKGLKSMKWRADKIGGTLNIFNLEKQFRVDFSLKVT